MSNPRQQFVDITNSIGTAVVCDIETERKMTVSTYNVKPIVRVSDIVQDQDPSEKTQEDHEFARRSIQEVIESGQEALQSAIECATASGDPDLFAAASSLMTSITESAAKLLDIQIKMRKIKLDEKKLSEPSAANLSKTHGDQTPATTQNFFLGTTDDLLRIMQQAKEKTIVSTQ
jgi:hypothetical protein